MINDQHDFDFIEFFVFILILSDFGFEPAQLESHCGASQEGLERLFESQTGKAEKQM